MKKIIVNIKASKKAKPLEMEMCSDLPVGDLLPTLVRFLGWPTQENNQPLYYWLSYQENSIDPKLNLTDAGIKNSDVLVVDSDITYRNGSVLISSTSLQKVKQPKVEILQDIIPSPFDEEPLNLEIQLTPTHQHRQTLRPPSTWKKIPEEDYR